LASGTVQVETPTGDDFERDVDYSYHLPRFLTFVHEGFTDDGNEVAMRLGGWNRHGLAMLVTTAWRRCVCGKLLLGEFRERVVSENCAGASCVENGSRRWLDNVGRLVGSNQCAA
jgi:hypothetical protein